MCEEVVLENPKGQISRTPPCLKEFNFEDLKIATNNFKPEALLGERGYGRIYKGWIDEKTLTPLEWGTAVAIHVNFAANYVLSEQIFLNCGESLILNDTDTQSWPDVKSKFSAKSLTSKATTQDPLVPKVPFMTTRVSHSEFSYSFPVVTGHALNYAYIVKEYLIAMDGETLTIKFTPSTNSLNAYAFVNGIEVMSMPDDIYKNDDGTLKLVDQDSLIYI
ncbi:hypothetical protein LWI29_033173 [Acer saccharum]|uniref:Uncharacterized protein n=1 Tax=Acer saccharum TaxID=4024 RepID=A0AA39TM14_ACESA|nr:hypothetical protein LWI29_033173 [Acer saccharum]